MPIRSLADDLRGRDNAALATLLAARPDLLHPVPADLTALAARAGAASSTARALDRLDRLTLQVAEVLAVLPEPCTTSAVIDAFPEEAGLGVAGALHRLRALALVWGDDDALRLVRTARDSLGRWPCGLGPSYAESLPMLSVLTAPKLSTLLESAPEEAHAILRRLTWGPPTGRIANTSSAMEWLAAHDLVARKDDLVTLPREVALLLRLRETGAPTLVRDPAFPPAEVTPGPDRGMDRVNRTSGQHALAATGAIATLLEAWSGQDAPSVLRKGGLAVRDLAQAARLLDTDDTTAIFWIELAYAAGLLARDGEIDEAWRPTPAYDDWREQSTAERWIELVEAWLATPRTPALVRSPVSPLSDDAEHPGQAALRDAVLDALAPLPDGHAPVDIGDVVRVIDERLPRSASAARDEFVRAILSEFELLGITGLGALSSAARDRSAIATHLPAPLDHVLIQADLTAVAPGPLVPEVDREIRSLADVESTGGATVFRFTESSVRRALDEGRAASDILDVLDRMSRTPVPQPLRYLVEDVARRHGVVRVGIATAYIRCDDETIIASILSDRRADALGLVRLSPTVLGTRGRVEDVLSVLRDHGLHPVAEAADGSTVLPARPKLRTPPRTPPRSTATDVPSTALINAAVKSLRGGARPPAVASSIGLDPMPAADTVAVLRRAIADAAPVWLGYSDDSSEHVVDPLRMAAGVLTAVDRTSGEVRTFAVSRILAAQPAL